MDDRDLRDRLEDLARRVDGAAAPDLHAVRQRHARRRTRAALAVGLSICLVAAALAWAAFNRGDAMRPLADTPPAVPFLWPENWAREGQDAVSETQAKADAGSRDLRWRTYPRLVAERFATDVLGWDQVSLAQRDLGPSVDGDAYELIPCPVRDESRTCDPDAMSPQQYVWVRQPVQEGPGGIWSVAMAWADTLGVGVGGQLTVAPVVVPTTASLHMELSPRQDEEVVVGVIGRSACSEFSVIRQQGADPALRPGQYTLALPDPVLPDAAEVACGHLVASVAFAYTYPSLNVPTGDPFLDPGDVLAVTATPFVLDRTAVPASAPPPGHEAGDAVTIRCDESAVSIVGSDTVLAQPDGVHIIVDDANNEPVSVFFQKAGFGTGGDPGSTEIITDSRPGKETVGCQTPSREIGSVSFTIVDPDDFYVEWLVDCQDPPSKSGPDWQPTSEQLAADPLLAEATEYLHSVVGPGVVISTGYPLFAEERTYALLQDGVPMGWVDYLADGGWVWDSYSACSADGGVIRSATA